MAVFALGGGVFHRRSRLQARAYPYLYENGIRSRRDFIRKNRTLSAWPCVCANKPNSGVSKAREASRTSQAGMSLRELAAVIDEQLRRLRPRAGGTKMTVTAPNGLS